MKVAFAINKLHSLRNTYDRTSCKWSKIPKEELVLKETNKIRRKVKEVARVKWRISLKDQNQKQFLKNQNKKQAKIDETNKEKNSDSEDEEIVAPFSDDEVVSEDDVEQPSDFDALTEVPKKHDYVLVEFKIRENNIV
ncbi:hypothetical protein JTB14_032928 [Gonioctena quinquepunctata]|nr:hypothetical protein JTB14_032928 [Gonioctena quinquepunctata]